MAIFADAIAKFAQGRALGPAIGGCEKKLDFTRFLARPAR
jgi:hypothetical protein